MTTIKISYLKETGTKKVTRRIMEMQYQEIDVEVKLPIYFKHDPRYYRKVFLRGEVMCSTLVMTKADGAPNEARIVTSECYTDELRNLVIKETQVVTEAEYLKAFNTALKKF